MTNPLIDPRTKAKADEVVNRTKLIIESGVRPEWMFLIQVNGGFLTLRQTNEKGSCIPLFTSPILAKDYMREFKVEGDVGGIKIENLPTSVPKWIDAGFAKFNLNRCPRCPDALLYDASVLLSVEKVTQCWAIVKATRDCQGGALLREAIQYQSAGLLAEARKTLETIRDHVAYDIPYVHQLIAFLAGMQNDHPAKALALKRLEEFGPEFALHPELWLEELARTQVSLLATFGLLKSDTRRER